MYKYIDIKYSINVITNLIFITIIITIPSVTESKTPRYFLCLLLWPQSSIWEQSQMPRAEEGKSFVTNKETA